MDEAIEIKALCHRYNVPLIINDNIEVALKSGADGVHVGIEDTPVAEIRKITGEDFIIGATAKTVEQARAAQAAGADYLESERCSLPTQKRTQSALQPDCFTKSACLFPFLPSQSAESASIILTVCKGAVWRALL